MGRNPCTRKWPDCGTEQKRRKHTSLALNCGRGLGHLSGVTARERGRAAVGVAEDIARDIARLAVLQDTVGDRRRARPVRVVGREGRDRARCVGGVGRCVRVCACGGAFDGWDMPLCAFVIGWMRSGEPRTVYAHACVSRKTIESQLGVFEGRKGESGDRKGDSILLNGASIYQARTLLADEVRGRGHHAVVARIVVCGVGVVLGGNLRAPDPTHGPVRHVGAQCAVLAHDVGPDGRGKALCVWVCVCVCVCIDSVCVCVCGVREHVKNTRTSGEKRV